jgi:hypothetical protein
VVFVYNVRFLWPMAMFFWFAAVFVAWQLVGPERASVRKVATGIELGCVVALVVVLGVRASAPPHDPTMKLARDLSAAVMPHLRTPGPYIIRSGGGGGGFVPVSTATASGVTVALERRGFRTYEFPGLYVSETIWGHRLYKGQRVAGTVWIVSGVTPPPSATARAVGTVMGSTRAQRAEERRLLRELRGAERRDGGVRLTAAGRRLLDGRTPRGPVDRQVRLVAAVRDPLTALADGSLASLVDVGLVDAPGRESGRLRRYESLRQLSSPAFTATAYVDVPG